IKNPLAIIIQGLESLKISLSSLPDNNVFHDIIGRIMNSAERADKIVDDLLSFSKETELFFEELNATAAVEEVLCLVEPQFEKKNIAIDRQFFSEETLIKADKNQIHQVFLNLLVNASEAMPDGGRIDVRIQPYQAEPDKRYVRIQFSDTGIGIPEDTIQSVFEPFFSTKTDSLKTGLGLSISRGIIEKHLGTIDITSVADKGTTVVIGLPAYIKKGRS
ncbi:sensor histidine kinase, partial [Thermodesulfobacteriota bacterium]